MLLFVFPYPNNIAVGLRKTSEPLAYRLLGPRQGLLCFLRDLVPVRKVNLLVRSQLTKYLGPVIRPEDFLSEDLHLGVDSTHLRQASLVNFLGGEIERRMYPDKLLICIFPIWQVTYPRFAIRPG